jgi:superfamily I DNA and/or RNA helicase
LNLTYRMQAEICAFISDAMYEGRLQPSEKARAHRVTMGGEELAGLYFMQVDHSGNSSSSLEEANAIVRQISLIYQYERDVIVVTPYNAQRRLISRKLTEAGLEVRVGTVDKFPGQEAAVVFYSMATSSGEDLPRDMEFLFERNRFNVAISRARAASVLVCSRRLLDISCRTPEEMALVNLLCAFVERADANIASRRSGMHV